MLLCLRTMFDDGNCVDEVQDDVVRFTDFAKFLRESPPGRAAFPNDDHLADVLSEALRLNPDCDWVCVDNDDCDGLIIKS